MKTATRIMVVAAMVAMAWAGPGMAQEFAGGGNNRCGPAGIWIGQNETFEMEFLFTIIPMRGNCFSAVAEGVGNDMPPWEDSTAWRGTLQKTGRRTYNIVQVLYAVPSGLPDPVEGVPDIAAARGRLTMLDCDHFEVEFEEIGIYRWGQTPFVDAPEGTFGTSHATYTRLARTCDKESEDD